MFQRSTRVGALPRIGVTGVVVFQNITAWLIIKFFQVLPLRLGTLALL
jgi:hypothetical protein